MAGPGEAQRQPDGNELAREQAKRMTEMARDPANAEQFNDARSGAKGDLADAARRHEGGKEQTGEVNAEAQIGKETADFLRQSRGIDIKGNAVTISPEKSVWLDGKNIAERGFTFDADTAKVDVSTWKDMAGTVDITVTNKDGSKNFVRISSDPNTSPTGNPAPKPGNKPADKPAEKPAYSAEAELGTQVVETLRQNRGIDIKGNNISIAADHSVWINGKAEAPGQFHFDNNTASVKPLLWRDGHTTDLIITNKDGSKDEIRVSKDPNTSPTGNPASKIGTKKG